MRSSPYNHRMRAPFGVTPEKPAPGQESVWDYPRPPRLEDVGRHLEVWLNGVRLADSRRAKRVLETSHPPVYYFPPEDVRLEHLHPASGSSFCEWKGGARYYDIEVDGRNEKKVAWYYPTPIAAFAAENAAKAAPDEIFVLFLDGDFREQLH